jgi:hypothetical protein
MQFRRQAHRVQIFAYTGYDREKRRSSTVQLGSIDARTFDDPKPADLFEKMTAEQRAELEAWIADRRVEEAIRLVKLLPDIRLGEVAAEIKRRSGL